MFLLQNPAQGAVTEGEIIFNVSLAEIEVIQLIKSYLSQIIIKNTFINAHCERFYGRCIFCQAMYTSFASEKSHTQKRKKKEKRLF